MFSNNDDFHNHPSSSSSAPRQEFRDVSLAVRTPTSGEHCQGETSDDVSCQIPGDKKRRLKPNQVKALEISFESGTKLDPDRKLQLARELGLQPRQVAIWFQNRRARWKTKKLEKDYDVLRRQVDSLRADNDVLKSQNKKLHSQLLVLRGKEISTDSAVCVRSDKGHPVVLPPLSNVGGPGAANLCGVLNPCSRTEQFQGQEGNFGSVFGESHQGFWTWPPEQQSFR